MGHVLAFIFLLVLVDNLYAKRQWSLQHRFPEEETYKCCL